MTSFVADDATMSNLSVSMGHMTVDDTLDPYDEHGNEIPVLESSPISLLSRQDYSRDVSPGLSSPPLRPESPELKPPKEEIDDDILAFNEQAMSVVEPQIRNAAPKFAVILSPHSYKHVFSRNWVTKREQTSVVERPERLRASCLGIGLARTAVPFKLMKSKKRVSLYAPHVEAVHGKDWAIELYALCNKAAAALESKQIEVPESWPYYDIYLSPNTVEALEGNIAAVEMGIDEIFNSDTHRAFVTVRPPGHHCHEDEASGFCLMNNAHIAIQYAKMKHQITHAVILDFDLHHGDGSQDLLWKLGFASNGEAEIPMGYFSIHDINSFPCEYGYAQPKQLSDASVCFLAHNSAIWNVHFQPYDTEEEFQRIYDSDYSVLFKRAADFLSQCRDKAQRAKKPFIPLVVISAGFDGSEFETPGMQRHQVHVPTSFYNRFTRDAVALAENFGTGHLLSLLEGGYSSAAVATGVFSHLTGMGEKAYKSDWCPSATPHEIDIGMRQRWKLHPENWTANGLSLGRMLFPPLQPPASAGAASESKHNLRSRRNLHSA